MGQSVYNLCRLLCDSLGLNSCGNWAGQKPQQAGPPVKEGDIGDFHSRNMSPATPLVINGHRIKLIPVRPIDEQIINLTGEASFCS